MKKKHYDFSGYATKNDVRCSDGRTIRKNAFVDNDGGKVPLVWQHMHDDPGNVLGHALLENREDGVYAYGVFNDTPAGINAKQLVKNGDISALSIYANKLVQKGGDVLHGAIREVSLVLTGANPEAHIENISIQHSDGSRTAVDSEVVIYSGDFIKHSEEEEGEEDMPGEKTIGDVLDTMNEEQKEVLYYMLGEAMEDSEDDDYDDEGEDMKHNVFESQNDYHGSGMTLSHSDFKAIMDDAKKTGSLRESFMAHAATYGIDQIDILFPDATTITPTPDFISREMGWVAGVMADTKHTPFSRIKSTAADVTAEEARARGYVKGNLKKEEVIKLLKRVTTPTTIYKKQKLDRDDIIDITDLDVVSYLKAEMRMMLDEELARAFLVGDGRDPASEDKINEENIRPIYKDDHMYSHKVQVSTEAGTDASKLIDDVIRARKEYKGKMTPKFYTTTDVVTEMLLLKDTTGRRIYNTVGDLAAALRVSAIVEVPVMENMVRSEAGKELALIGIMVNLNDYAVGADKGGAVNMFDDFDIDYNQFKYLIETRCSGALIHPKTALVFEKVKAAA